MVSDETWVRWITPASDASVLCVDNIAETQNGLEVRLRILAPEERTGEFKVIFTNVLFYKVGDESYDLPESSQPASKPRPGRTITVQASRWLAKILRTAPHMIEIEGPCTHYSISGDDRILDVITTNEPSIEALHQGA